MVPPPARAPGPGSPFVVMGGRGGGGLGATRGKGGGCYRYYVLLHHGGGLSGLMQIPDLWLHNAMERVLGDMEVLDGLWAGHISDRVFTQSRQQLLDNAATAWKHSFNHNESIAWTKRTGLSLPLLPAGDPGNEDHLLSRAVKQFWDDLDMRAKISEALRDIDADIDAGLLTSWGQAPQLLAPFPRGDVEAEGLELQPGLADGEKAYQDASSTEGSEEGDDDDDDDDTQTAAITAENAAEALLTLPAPAASGPSAGSDLSAAASGPSPASSLPAASAPLAVIGASAGPEGDALKALQAREANYEAMLSIAQAQGSGIEAGALLFLKSKLLETKKAMKTLRSDPAQIRAANAMKEKQRKLKEELQRLKEREQAAEKARKAAKQAAKRKKEKKAAKKKAKKGKKKEKKGKGAKKKETTKKSASEGTDDSSEAESSGGAVIPKKAKKMQALSHAMPMPDVAKLALATAAARTASLLPGAVAAPPGAGLAPPAAGAPPTGGCAPPPSPAAKPVPTVAMQAEAQAAEGELHKDWDVQDFGKVVKRKVTLGGVPQKRNRFEAWCRLKRLAELKGHVLPPARERRWHEFLEWREDQELKRLRKKGMEDSYPAELLTQLLNHQKDYKKFIVWLIHEMDFMPAKRLAT